MTVVEVVYICSEGRPFPQLTVICGCMPQGVSSNIVHAPDSLASEVELGRVAIAGFVRLQCVVLRRAGNNVVQTQGRLLSTANTAMKGPFFRVWIVRLTNHMQTMRNVKGSQILPKRKKSC